MKLLFDQNLSFKLVNLIEQYFPESSHIKLLNLSKSNDLEIWKYARGNNFSIISQDVDFVEISLVNGTPPKIIWLRCGNTTTNHIHDILLTNYLRIIDFINEPNTTTLQIF